MITVVNRIVAYTAVAASLALAAPSIASAGTGQDFPGVKCTCVDCNGSGSDLIGQCDSVCKDKTVFAKGSEPLDYCRKDNSAKDSDKKK
jgi:hypothetical protein